MGIKLTDAVHLYRIMEKDGEIYLKGLPYKKGEPVEMIVMRKSRKIHKKISLTSRRLLDSGIIGLWSDRKDVKNSVKFADKLRKKAQKRGNR